MSSAVAATHAVAPEVATPRDHIDELVGDLRQGVGGSSAFAPASVRSSPASA